MENPIRPRAPFSPVLLLGLALRPLPLAPLQPLCDIALKGLARRHREAFAGLSEAGAPVVVVDPTDLPFAFVLRLDPERPRLTVSRQAEHHDANATVRGPLLRLIDLMEGRLDGDSLFFSRDLAVEGEAEVVVALRNALERAEIDLETLLGPWARPLFRRARASFARAADDLEALRASMIAPAMQYADNLAAGLEELGERVAARDGRSRTDRTPGARTAAP